MVSTSGFSTLSQLFQCEEGSMLNPGMRNHESSPKQRLRPASSSQAPSGWAAGKGSRCGITATLGPPPQALPDQLWEARKTVWGAGLKWTVSAPSLRSKGCHLSSFTSSPSLPTYPWPSVMTFSCSHFWQLPDTVSQTSLEANYHANCQSRKQCLIAVLCQCQHINPSLTRQLKINKNATLTYVQLSGETMCPKL